MKPWQWVQLALGSFVLLIWGTAVLSDIVQEDYEVPDTLHYGCTLLMGTVLGSGAILSRLSAGGSNSDGGQK